MITYHNKNFNEIQIFNYLSKSLYLFYFRTHKYFLTYIYFDINLALIGYTLRYTLWNIEFKAAVYIVVYILYIA